MIFGARPTITLKHLSHDRLDTDAFRGTNPLDLDAGRGQRNAVTVGVVVGDHADREPVYDRNAAT